MGTNRLKKSSYEKAIHLMKDLAPSHVKIILEALEELKQQRDEALSELEIIRKRG